MESESRNVTVVSGAEMIVKELEADLAVGDDAVFA